MSEPKLRDLNQFETSTAYSDLEKLVLRFAIAMTSLPAEVPDELFSDLMRHFDKGQLVELTSSIAWENYRARFNRVFEIEPDGFSDGAFCVVPERIEPGPSGNGMPAAVENHAP